MLGGTGCMYKVVHSPPLVVRSPETGREEVVNYPVYVVVHDARSPWDAHQVKDNMVGLFDGEVVHWTDLVLDGVIPGPDQRPLQNGIEWVKNEYAQLPDCAPVRIVGGFFSAVFLEKSTVLSGIRIAAAPMDPVSYFAVTRAIYLTDWVQETMGEVNAGLGHLVPWKGPFVPRVVTAPINGAVDWAQNGAITTYTYVFRQVSIGVDNILYGCEWGWGSVVSLFVARGEPVNQAPAQAAPMKQ